jgi:phytoene dehydrogenase-like protein
MESIDAVVVGAGPNGLTAAVVLAEAGLAVRVYEAAEQVGGGARTEALTLPGFLHDSCSAVHPLGAGSPVFRALPLARYGFEWVHPDIPMAHALANGRVALLSRSAAETAGSMGAAGRAYLRLIAPFRDRWGELATDVLRAPLLSWPAHPVTLARFGARAVLPVEVLTAPMRDERARALLAGLAGHAIAVPTAPATGGVALLFALAAHAVGWPFPRGGSQSLADALAAHVRALGGEIVTGQRVASLAELPAARAYLLDTSIEGLLQIAGDRLPRSYVARLRRYHHGPAVFKIDYALSEPVPWTAEECRHAGTVHVGASAREVATSLRAVVRGRAPDAPFLITTQPSLFDPTRAPQGRHTFWLYAHAPYGWRGDLTDSIERQLERIAPGFRDVVLARTVAGPPEIESRNPNNVGGDIAGGRFAGLQALFRPVLARVPYASPNPTLYLCSSATPPGPGVHGMCGYHAAHSALARTFGRDRRRAVEARGVAS